MIKIGYLTLVIFYTIFMAMPLIYSYLSLKGRKFSLKRKIAGLEAIPEAISRAAELGGPCAGTCGGITTYSMGGPQIIAGLTLLGYITRLAIKQNVEIYLCTREADQSILAQDIMKTAYAAEGKLEQWNPKYNVWFGNDRAYEAGYMGLIESHNIQSNFLLGRFGSEIIPFSEIGARKGCMQIAGTPNIFGAIWMIPSCDYVMIADELFAAAAIISENPIELATVVSSDSLRLIIIATIIISTIIFNLGFTNIINLLKM